MYIFVKNLNDMIDSRDYPPEEFENTCNYCGEECAKEFCDNNCKKAYEND